MPRLTPVILTFSLALLVPFANQVDADAKDKKEPAKVEKKAGKQPNLRILSPTGGEEVELADWRFTLGTRRFSLAKDAKPKDGPEYLEFREDKSTTFQNGILTLVPLAAIKKIDYDKEKKVVDVLVLADGAKDITLTGTTKYIGINKITIEGDLLLGGGVGTQKIQGGVDKGGVRRITFPAPKPVAEATGKVATVLAIDKEKSKHEVHDLQPLYFIDGVYRTLPYLMFKKTARFELSNLVTLRSVPPENKKVLSYDFELTMKDGSQLTLSLLTKIDTVDEKSRPGAEKAKSATFEGLIGRVAAGYKLFPAHTIQHVRLSEHKEKLDAQ